MIEEQKKELDEIKQELADKDMQLLDERRRNEELQAKLAGLLK